MNDSPALLEVKDLHVRFGAIRVINGVSLALRAGERHALLGTNGAGKSTLFNAITGTVQASAGEVLYKGQNIGGLPVCRRARLGFGRTFQISQCFADRTVAENIQVAAAARLGPALGLLPWSSYRGLRQRVQRCLAQTQLEDIAHETVGSLSYGRQREVEVAMALVAEPDLLLLDEPAAGLSPNARTQLVARLQALPRSVTLLLVEHDMDVALKLADRVTVMRDGEVVASGTPDQIRQNRTVKEMYLGTRH